jgi:hypothetical protein
VIAEDFLQHGEGRLAGAMVTGEILDYFPCESELPGEWLWPVARLYAAVNFGSTKRGRPAWVNFRDDLSQSMLLKCALRLSLLDVNKSRTAIVKLGAANSRRISLFVDRLRN